jgi:prepilin-type processing-associated H-X9-DG protein
MSDLPSPSETILVGEIRWISSPILWFDAIFYAEFFDGSFGSFIDKGRVHHHRKRVNFLFADGHARSLKAVQTFTPKQLWGPFSSLISDPKDTGAIERAIQRIGPEYR